MFVERKWNIHIFIILVSPISAAVAKHVINSCNPTEFACGDGGCVSAELVCDGNTDCADGLDEATCASDTLTWLLPEPIHRRSRRQASTCRKNQSKCRDGSCISFDSKCDGVIDCPDSSDETHALCRKTVCQKNWFRCTYGACVDGTAPCNGEQECADNSDELLPRCRNETDEVRGQFKCLDGSTIPAASHCDGVRDCTDGSDETVRSCAAKSCPSYMFQCAYGACVDSDANCNQVQECADGSDEAAELCDKSGTAPITPYKPPKGNCVMPPYPDHGTYITNVPNGRPGEAYEFLVINVTCRQNYGVQGSASISCYKGWWPEPMPSCVSLCHLTPHPSVEYNCIVSEGGVTGSRPCKEYEPHGTVVSPRCQTPNYYSRTSLKFMHCINDLWDYVAICIPECGIQAVEAPPLIIGSNFLLAKYGEVPWHSSIYRKTSRPYDLICGGSLISANRVISAAHCFWDDFTIGPHPASDYVVAFGKYHRDFDSRLDKSQSSNVEAIRISPYFKGSTTNFQSDIAVLELTTTIEFSTRIRPVCVDYDRDFEERQLQPGNKGKVAGWGLISREGQPTDELRVMDLPFVPIMTCFDTLPQTFFMFVTSDKICAGYDNAGTAVCKGDSGGGLAFSTLDKGVPRYYLRGVVSTAPTNNDACNTDTYTTFTRLITHEEFIKLYERD